MASDGSHMIIVAYLDDMVIVGRNKSELSIVADQISKHVDLRVEPSVKRFLVMFFNYDWEKGILNISNNPL